MQSPLLPWEVIERVMGHSGDHRETLHSVSLACRDLRPRALCLLVAHVVFKRRPPIFDFCDFLQARPHLKPLVRSIVVNPNDFAPFPLLSILPNLSTLTFTDAQLDPWQFAAIPVLNRSSLICCKHLGTHIQTLHFSKLSFPTYLDFARVLLVFANVTHLVCSTVVVKAEGNQAALDVIKQRLSKRLHLLSIDIDFSFHFSEFYEYVHDKPSVAALLLDSGLVQSTAETVIVQKPYRSRGLPRPFGWPQLRSLVLKVEFKDDRDVVNALVFLKDFPPSTLTDVMVELLSVSFYGFITLLSGEASPKPWEELEQALLKFPQPRIVCHADYIHDSGHSFWTQELGKWFPALCQRKALTFVSGIVTPGAGHDGEVWDLTPSPDGKWIATGSRDGTIILWNHIDGTIARRWVAHSYKIVTFLAFSPDGRYLLSCGDDPNIKIWDLSGGSGSSEFATTLEEHANNSCCAWSPNGDIIASVSDNQTILLWDTRTFHQLHELKHAGDVYIMAIAFSPDGRWLASGCPVSYDIWNVASGTLHKSFLTQSNNWSSHSIPLAFDPNGGMRLAIMPEYRVVKILDVETGEELAVLRGVDMPWDVAFSPDGSLVTSTSDDNGLVKLWDAYTGVELFSLEGHEGVVNQARFSPCGKYVASASYDGTVRLWRTNDGSCVMTFSEHKDSNVAQVAFSPDGETLWSADDDGMVIMRRMRDIISIDEQGL